MMRILLTIVIAGCALVIIIGYILVQNGHIQTPAYLNYATIAGALASVIGLLSLVRPRISSQDISELELGAIKRIQRTTEAITLSEDRLAVTSEELSILETQKHKMEILVREASLKLFLEEQLSNKSRYIVQHIDNNSELKRALEDQKKINTQLQTLGIDKSTDPNVVLLNQIIEESKSMQYKSREEIMRELNVPPSLRILIEILFEIGRRIGKLYRF